MNSNQKLTEFIAQCPTGYHTVQTVADTLKAQGYRFLPESENWQLKKGGSYFVTRNGSSLIAFRIPKEEPSGFMMTASHSDSPAFKLKPNAEMTENGVIKLNVEKYGGMILESWLDRPLSVAGRITVETEDGIQTRLVDIDKDLLVIPNTAIHLQSAADNNRAHNPQTDMLPLFGCGTEKGGLLSLLAEHAGVKKEEILDGDLFVYSRSCGTVWGLEDAFVSAPRIDDLACVFASLQGFLQKSHPQTIPVYCVFDNEEVGSGTKQGAKSTFLKDVLTRAVHGLGYEETQYLRMLTASFMLSCDNGHAVHPNHPEKSDPINRPQLNGGVLLKYNANQKYTTDAVSGGIFRKICKKAEVPVQEYVNRSDIPGGSTLGNLSTEKVSVNAADIGLPQLAMHSAWETAGARDMDYLCRAVAQFYRCRLQPDQDGYGIDFV